MVPLWFDLCIWRNNFTRVNYEPELQMHELMEFHLQDVVLI